MKISQPYHEELTRKRFNIDQWKPRDTPLPLLGKKVMCRDDYEQQTEAEKFASARVPGKEFVGSFLCMGMCNPVTSQAICYLGSHTGEETDPEILGEL